MSAPEAQDVHVSPSLPAWRCPRAVVLFAALFTLLLASDLAFKAWSFQNVPRDGEIGLVPKVLSLRLTLNTGAVFGIMGGQKAFFISASVFAAGFIGWFFVNSRANERAIHAALALILGGAMGNLYDRVRFGAVRDMLNLFPGVKLPFGWEWSSGADEIYPWIFNLADVYLLVGIGVMLIRSVIVPAAPGDADTGKAAP